MAADDGVAERVMRRSPAETGQGEVKLAVLGQVGKMRTNGGSGLEDSKLVCRKG